MKKILQVNYKLVTKRIFFSYNVIETKLQVNVDSNKQSGIYTCKAKNRAGYVQHNVHLLIDS